nr:hypothetical protein [Tanacetum cinerariifolium]
GVVVADVVVTRVGGCGGSDEDEGKMM